MRVAIASSGLGHVARGIEAWAGDLAAALHKRGMDVRLFQGGGKVTQSYQSIVSCLQRDSASMERLLRFVPRPVGWRVGFGSSYAAEQTTFAFNLIRELRRHRADILHVQDPLVAYWAQWARRVGVIRTKSILAHGTEEPIEFLRQIEYLQHLAPWHAEQIKQQGTWKQTWTTIPNFIDVERYAPGHDWDLRDEMSIPRDAKVVLCVAAIKRGHKRIDYLLSEYAKVKVDNCYLVVAGGREGDTDSLIAEGQQLLGDHVRFLVRYPRERMASLYKIADLFVLPSLFEMMPIALIEASASGLPCLTHHHPNLTWMTGVGGIGIDMAQEGALAGFLASYLEHDDARFERGSLARAYSIEMFSETKIVDDVANYYHKILAS